MKKGANRIRYSDNDKAKVQQLKERGLNDSQIAKQAGVGYQTVRAWLYPDKKSPSQQPTHKPKAMQPNIPTERAIIDYERLFSTMLNRLVTLETDPSKKPVLLLLQRRTEHINLLLDLYADSEPFHEKQAPAVQSHVEESEPEQPVLTTTRAARSRH
jgi:hypothetical protein